MFYKSLLKPLLFQIETEQAHEAACRMAKTTSKNRFLYSTARRIYNYQSPKLSQTFWSQKFRNPVGLAAGFDKNGHMISAMEALGMGFVEVGSVTAQANPGNPKPRAFRLPADHALINRMGLNNDGAKTIIKRLEKTDYTIPVGINIAKTHNSNIMGTKAINDYLTGYKEALKIADYITINISCPNTAEGKTFEHPNVLDNLLSVLMKEQSMVLVPTLVKFSPDLERPELEQLLEICEMHQIDGYVAVNTSSLKKNLNTEKSKLEEIGSGGLSGAPLHAKSARLVQWIRSHIGSQKPIIGVGGIHSFETALQMLRSGANLLQIYTGLVYEGPGLVKRINKQLAAYMESNGIQSLDKIR